MHQKAVSVSVLLVAVVGCLLAAFIPTASASRTPRATSCDTTASSYTGGDVPCTVQVTASKGIPSGTAVDPDVVVTKNNNGNLTFSDHGRTVSLPRGAIIEFAPDGSFARLSTRGHSGRGTITLLGGKIKSIYLHPSVGITFGANHTLSQILNYVTYFHGATREEASSTVFSTPHGQLVSTLKTPSATATASVNGRILEYTQPEIKSIKAHHVKAAAVFMDVTTTTGKHYSYTVSVPISTLTVQTFPKN